MKYLAHMINLLLVNTMTNAHFAEIMDELKQTQRIFRMQPAIVAIGCKCPKFVRPRWFFMMDTLAYFVANFELCTAFLMKCVQAFDYRDRLPLEIVELYIIMIPFSCFVSAVESRARALPDIIPLSRQLLTIVRNVFPLIRTNPTRKIFHEFHVQFLARLMVNNDEDAIAAYTLTLQERQEL
jgi:hypothetical protein